MTLKSNLKTKMINWLRTTNLTGIIFFTIAVVIVTFSEFSDIEGYISSNIYNSTKSDSIKDLITLILDVAMIIRTFLPTKLVNCLFFIMVALWCAIIYFRIYEEDKEKPKKMVHVIGHYTLGECQFKVDENFNRIYTLDVNELNLIEQMNSIKMDFKELNYVIKSQDLFIDNFKRNINNEDKYGYMGIAHTPMILRAGYRVGDETKFNIFHKKRDSDYFAELNNSEVYTDIRIEKEEIKQDSKELVVAISTTFPIEDKNLFVLNYKEKSIIKFKTDDLGFDVIISNKQIEQYINTILHEVRQIVRDNDIRKIHMVISSSVAFSFALGQRLSSNYDPEIIVYHYDYNNEKKYPWGISLFNDYTNCIVETEILNHNI